MNKISMILIIYFLTSFDSLPNLGIRMNIFYYQAKLIEILDETMKNPS